MSDYNQIYKGCIPPVDVNVDMTMPKDGCMKGWTGAVQRKVTNAFGLRWRHQFEGYTGDNVVYLILGKRVQQLDGRLEDSFGHLLLSRSVC
jgi:hypothetical protein